MIVLYFLGSIRVACTDFIELYKKKHSDDQWMGELAAVQAYPMPDLSYMGTSGIMLAGDLSLVRTASSELDATVTSGNSDSSKGTLLHCLLLEYRCSLKT